jgi:hypothetical protein
VLLCRCEIYYTLALLINGSLVFAFLVGLLLLTQVLLNESRT